MAGPREWFRSLTEEPLARDLRRIADALEALVELKRYELGLPLAAHSDVAQALDAQAQAALQVPPALIDIPDGVSEALRQFAADQGFATAVEAQEDPYGFAQRHGWVTPDGVIQVDLSPYLVGRDL